MKKLIAATLLCASATSVFGSGINSDIKEEAKGNWTGSFKLMNGTVIEHTPEYTKMDFMHAGTGIRIGAGFNLNGYVY